MRCAKCASDNRDGRKFCAKCGVALAHQCQRCGASNEPGEDFCGECGAALAAIAVARVSLPQAASAIPDIRITPEQPDTSTVIDGERKTVTALFADIKGSTELMEDLDPEEARAIIDPALKLMIEAVRRYDGYVVQSTGDGIFALFGAPLAHEDHPQRALYAALRLQEELGRYSAKVVADGSSPIQGRVGINTGEVVVRSIRTGASQVEYTPIGHTTNLASRMQVAAPVGSIAVSEATRKLCEGYFILKPLGATKIKGVSEPVNVYEVTGLGPLRTRLQRAVGRGLTKFVGRGREMEALGHAAELASGGRGQIVAAMAEPGVGKSRLYFEFKAISQSGWMVLETFSISHGKANAYLPVIDLLRNYFDISPGDDERKRREKVTGRVVALDRSLEDTLPYLFTLLGIVEGNDPLAQMDGQIKKRRTLEAIKRILLRESLNQPLMVIFEDLHWIDDATQEFLNLLADSIGTAKILLLVNYRPEYSHQWGNKTYYTQLRLDPLGKETAETMLSALLTSPAPAIYSQVARRERSASDIHLADGVRTLDDLSSLKRLIIERTEGNPFFMEEIVQALFEEGALIRNGAVHLTRPLDSFKVPATVQAILASRIDRLPPDEKELIQTLATVGREFSLSLVREIIQMSADHLDRMMNDLQLAKFVYEQPALGDVEYIFKHALTQQVAHDSMLIERRKALHEKIGQAIESLYSDRLDDHFGELAHHFSCSDNAQKAVEYLGRAGQQALQRSAYADGINHLAAAIDLLQRIPESPERIQGELLLQLAAGPALIATKGWGKEMERAYTRARELCARLGDPLEELFSALYGLWAAHLLRGELRESNQLAEQLLRQAESAHDATLLLYARYALGTTSSLRGEFLSAREQHEIAIALYDPERHRVLTARYEGVDAGVLNFSLAALTLWVLGYPEQALKRSNEAIALAERLSHPQSLCRAGMLAGTLHQLLRDVREVQHAAEGVIALGAEHGITESLPFVTIHRGWAVAAQGRHEEGIALIHEGLAMFRAAGVEAVRTSHLSWLAEVCLEAGRFDEGLSALADALFAVEQHDERYCESEIHRLKGELLLSHDDSQIAEAHSCLERAIEIARKQSAKSWELRATMSLARLLAKEGHRDEARAMLAEIYNWFTEGFDTADLKHARVLLDELNA